MIFFGGVGAAFLAHWVLTDPTSDESAAQSEWLHVLAFSALLSLLGVAVLVAASLAPVRGARPAAFGASAGAGIVAAANVFEDGFGLSWVFYVTALGTSILLLALGAWGVAVGFSARGAERVVMLVPLGALIGVVFYVLAGGPIMLATWLLAAVLTFTLRRRVVRAT